MALYDRSHGFTGTEMPAALTAHLKRKPLLVELDGASYYIEQVSSAGRVYVFGCGHVAQELVPVLSHVGFRCVAMDDREEFAQKALFPDAEEVLLVDFNHIDEVISVTAEDYACVMTRGHASDAVIQAQLLRTPASYIGVIGSARKKAGVYQKLRRIRLWRRRFCTHHLADRSRHPGRNAGRDRHLHRCAAHPSARKANEMSVAIQRETEAQSCEDWASGFFILPVLLVFTNAKK